MKSKAHSEARRLYRGLRLRDSKSAVVNRVYERYRAGRSAGSRIPSHSTVARLLDSLRVPGGDQIRFDVVNLRGVRAADSMARALARAARVRSSLIGPAKHS